MDLSDHQIVALVRASEVGGNDFVRQVMTLWCVKAEEFPLPGRS